jgi:N-methylhydantoinase A
MRLSDYSAAAAKRVLDELKAEAAAFVRSCDASAEIEYEARAYMRYVGQGWEIPVDFGPGDAADPSHERCLRLFEAAYKVLFGRTVDGVDIEVTSWAVKAGTPLPPADTVAPLGTGGEAPVEKTQPLFDPGLGRQVDARVAARAAIAPGQRLAGPAMITENETTVVIPTGFTAAMRADGTIEVSRQTEAQS